MDPLTFFGKISKMKDILLVDYLSTFNDDDFSKYITSYIRIRELAQFAQNIVKNENFDSNLMTNNDYKWSLETKSNSSMMYEENQEEDLNNNDHVNFDKELSAAIWLNITDILEYCKENNHLKELYSNYNKIIKLHLEHKISLDSQCFDVLLYCSKPSYIELLFNKELIKIEDSVHIGCWFKRGLFFHGLNNFNILIDTLPFLNPLISSLTILLYKTKCQKYSKSIIDCLNKQLAVFVNKESTAWKKNMNWINFKNRYIKIILKAVYLNGIFKKASFIKLLDNKESTYYSDFTDSDSDDWPDTDLSSVNSDMDVNNNEIYARVVPKPSFGERINTKPNSQEIDKMFPYSLKNLSRLQIKHSLKTYSLKNVSRLSILPKDLKGFILFQNEIDDAKRFFS